MVTAAWMLTIHTHSQTIINTGPVSGTWTASGSPYHIMGDINVPAGNTLVIEPGVTVKTFSELSFKVYGRILAVGTQSNQITFVPNYPYYWKGLQIINSPDTSTFECCSFSNFINRTADASYNLKGGAIYTLNSQITIKTMQFHQ